MITCIFCQEREATVNDLFCPPCADEIGQEGMQHMRNTLKGQMMLVHKAGSDLFSVIKGAIVDGFGFHAPKREE